MSTIVTTPGCIFSTQLLLAVAPAPPPTFPLKAPPKDELGDVDKLLVNVLATEPLNSFKPRPNVLAALITVAVYDCEHSVSLPPCDFLHGCKLCSL